MERSELLETIDQLTQREQIRARNAALDAPTVWDREIQGTGVSVHDYVRQKQAAYMRARAVVDTWEKLRRELETLDQTIQRAVAEKTVDLEARVRQLERRCPVCEHDHPAGQACGADVIIGGHADNPYCGPGETETTQCACTGPVPVTVPDRCLCGGRGCNSCEPQGRG
jgi:hypothetical protein